MAQVIAPGLDDLENRVTLSIEEAARLLGLGRTAAYEAARRGELPTRRLGRRLIVPVPAARVQRAVGELRCRVMYASVFIRPLMVTRLSIGM